MQFIKCMPVLETYGHVSFVRVHAMALSPEPFLDMEWLKRKTPNRFVFLLSIGEVMSSSLHLHSMMCVFYHAHVMLHIWTSSASRPRYVGSEFYPVGIHPLEITSLQFTCWSSPVGVHLLEFFAVFLLEFTSRKRWWTDSGFARASVFASSRHALRCSSSMPAESQVR